MWWRLQKRMTFIQWCFPEQFSIRSTGPTHPLWHQRNTGTWLIVYLALIDHLINELITTTMQPNAEAESPVPAPFKGSSTFRRTLKWDQGWLYSPLMPDVQAADSELEACGSTPHTMWRLTICALSLNTKFMFSYVHCMFKIPLTMPVSTATAKHSFSWLQRLKTYT